jgi:adenylate cyclase
MPAVPKDEIRGQLQGILDSPEFLATDKQRQFLEFVVSETLNGRADQIKGFTVATCVFGRSADFDQSTDPIVSIQANKLRRALERYYLVEGQNDPVLIEIPKGTYVPAFRRQGDIASESVLRDEAVESNLEAPWPTLLVRPFQNLTGDPALAYIGIGLAMDLATEITRHHEVRVMVAQDKEAEQTSATDTVARFVIYGSVFKDGGGMKVNVSLEDTKTGIQVWGGSHASPFHVARLISFQEEAANTIAAKIASEYGTISKTLRIESKRKPPSELSTYEAILRYHEFNSNFCAETFFSAFESLTLASEREPDCGAVWGMLARLYANNYSLELFDLDTPLEEALAFAQKGVRLDPDNQRVRATLAYVLLLRNELSEGIAEVERAIALNPNSLMLMDNFGYLLTLLGDWRRGPAMIRKAIELNPYYSVVVHYPLWVDWIRQGDYEQAYLETLNFRTPGLFWDPLIKAAGLGLLGRLEEGKDHVDGLLRLKPEFSTRGRVLIKHYIKFDDIVQRTVEGLSNVGLKLE